MKEILSDAVGNTLELEGEIDGDTLEVCVKHKKSKNSEICSQSSLYFCLSILER